MPTVDGGKLIRDRLVARGVLQATQIFLGPQRPAVEVLSKEAIFVNDQGGLPSEPYLNSEGTQTTNYYDVWVRSSTVLTGRARCHAVRDALQLYTDTAAGLVSMFFVQGPSYQGRDGEDAHTWRCSYKTKLYEAKS